MVTLSVRDCALLITPFLPRFGGALFFVGSSPARLSDYLGAGVLRVLPLRIDASAAPAGTAARRARSSVCQSASSGPLGLQSRAADEPGGNGHTGRHGHSHGLRASSR
jgi:hypothetical protein